MDLERPAFVLLVVPAMLLALAAARRSAVGLSPLRSGLAMALRGLLLLALGLVLARARAVLPHDERAVVFAVDVSESVPPQDRRRLLDWTRKAWAARRPGDRAGLVLFGSRARVDVPLGESFDPAEPSLEGLPRDRTAIDQALRTAAGLLRGVEAERSIVLLSDGNGDATKASREAMALASTGVDVTTVALELVPSPREVLVGDVVAPPLVGEGEAFLLKVQVVARSGGPAKLHLEVDGKQAVTTEVELAPGTNVVSLPQRLDRPGAALFRVTVDAEGDGDQANNAGGAFVQVRGRPRVLYVQGPARGADGRTIPPAEVARPLADALERAGLEVVVRAPDGLPGGLEDLAGWAAFVLGDVSAERWTEEQMAAVRDWVHDQGGGLVTLGGEEAYGLGGYHKTPIEDALPVSCSLRGKKVLPALALVLVIDRSGSMSESVAAGDPRTKLRLAQEGAARALEALQPFDKIGVTFFDEDPLRVIPLTTLDEPRALAAKVLDEALDTGGGTHIGPALMDAHRALSAVQAPLKHVVLLTDGKSSPADWTRIIGDFRRDRITISTVGVGSDLDRQLLKDLAERTGGRFVITTDPRTVPRLLTKEAQSATRALLVEREVVPRVTGPLGVDLADAPPLLGFVLTHPKPEAEVLLDTGPDETVKDGPILVRWRHGLGKAASFTSDATGRWCARWLGWRGFDPLLGEVVRWAARDPEPPGFRTALTLEQGQGVVRVTASREDGEPLDGLVLEGRVSGPPGAPTPAVRLEQTGPGAYEAEVQASRPGAYLVQIAARGAGGERAVGSAGAVLAYPREYRDLTSDRALLDQVARVTRGQALTLDDPPSLVFGGERVGRRSMLSLDPWLLALAAVLLVLDVAARRLTLPDAPWRRRLAAPSAASLGTLESLKAHKDAERGAIAARLAAQKAASDRMSRSGTAPVAPPPTTTPAATPTTPPKVEPPKPVTPPPKPPPAAPPKAAPKPDVDDDSPMGALLRAKRQARGKDDGKA